MNGQEMSTISKMEADRLKKEVFGCPGGGAWVPIKIRAFLKW